VAACLGPALQAGHHHLHFRHQSSRRNFYPFAVHGCHLRQDGRDRRGAVRLQLQRRASGDFTSNVTLFTRFLRLVYCKTVFLQVILPYLQVYLM